MAGNIKSASYVLDASFVLALLLPDETKNDVKQIFEQFSLGLNNLYTSTLLPFEVFNGLRMAVLRKRLKIGQALELGKTFLAWDIHYEPVQFLFVAELALKEKLTVYDASYLWLAKQKKIQLLTLDRDLMRIAK